MASTSVVVPDLGYEISEATFVAFHKKTGDALKKGELVAEISTEKTTVEIDAPCDGVVAWHADLSENDVVSVGQTLVDIENATDVSEPEEPLGIVGVSTSAPVVTPSDSGSQILATREAKQLAKTHGVNLAEVTGTGPGGRITENDVEAVALARQKSDSTKDGFFPLGSMYTEMYRHMSGQALVPMPTVTDVANITAWWPKKKRELTARVIDAMTTAVDSSPRVNATFTDGLFRLNREVSIAIAVDTESGLIVPVVRNCERLESISDVVAAVNALSQKTRDGKLTPADTRGATLALSNFGSFGFGITGQMIIPKGLVLILGVGRVLERSVPDPLEGTKKIALLPLSITFDHRYLTGGQACRFGAAVRDALEGRY